MPRLFSAPRRRKLTMLSRARRRIQKLGPYPSMALLAVPLMLVEPLKLVGPNCRGQRTLAYGNGDDYRGLRRQSPVCGKTF